MQKSIKIQEAIASKFTYNPDWSFTGKTIEHNGRTLREIVASVDMKRIRVKKGEVGGYIEDMANVKGGSFVKAGGMVFGMARIDKGSLVHKDCKVFGNAMLFGTNIFNGCQVGGRAFISNSFIDGKFQITGKTSIEGCDLVKARKIDGEELKNKNERIDIDYSKLKF